MKAKNRFKKIVLWSGAAVLFVLSVVAGRLMMGPVSANMLMSVALTTVNTRFPNLVLDYDDSQVVWNDVENSIDLRLEGLALSMLDDPLQANIPEVSMAFSIDALKEGKLAPSRIDLVGIQMDYSWDAQALYRLLSAELNPQSVEMVLEHEDETSGSLFPVPVSTPSDDSIVKVIRRILREPDQIGPLGYLKRLRIQQATLVMNEVHSATRWSFPDSDIAITRQAYGAAISIDLPLTNDGKEARFKFQSDIVESGEMVAVLNFDNIHFANLARSVNMEEPFKIADLPLFGTINVIIDNNDISLLSYDVSSGIGVLNIPQIYEEPLKIEALAARGSYVPEQARLNLDSFFTSVSGGEVTSEGSIVFPIGGREADAQFVIRVNQLPVKDLPRLWPARFGTNGHTWVANNLESGLIREGRVNLDIRPEDKGVMPKPQRFFNAEFQFEDLKAHFLRPMPAITAARGNGYVNTQNLEIYLEGGDLNKVEVGSSRVYLYDFAEGAKATIEVQASGEIPDIIQVLNFPPLSLSQKYGVNAARLGGSANAMVTLNFPLTRELTFDDVQMDISADTTNVSVEGVIANGDLTNGELSLSINNEGLTGKGPIEINEVPFDLVWHQRFETDPNVYGTHYTISGDVSGSDLEAIGVPLEGIVGDGVEFSLSLEGNGEQIVRGKGEANLFASPVTVDFANWSKPANIPALASFNLNFSDEILSINDIAVEAADFSVVASAKIDRVANALSELSIQHLVTEANELSLEMKQLDIAGYDVKVAAKSFDARPFLEDLLSNTGSSDQPPLKIQMSADRMVALNDVVLNTVSLSAEDMGNYWSKAQLSAKFANGTTAAEANRALSFDLTSNQNGRQLRLNTDDAGRAVLATGLFINAQGGVMALNADIQGVGDDLTATGELEIENFRLVKSSSLVQAIAQARGQDIDKMLSDGGMSFNQLALPFTINSDVIDFPKSIANGSSIGFTMEGQLSRDLKQVNINGVVIPAYALNALISNIPLVGNLLVGGKGEGLFAIPYRISGPTSNPNVSASAAAALAPGFLRGFFEGKKGKVDTTKPSNDN